MRKISMSKIKEVLRLKYLNQLSNRQIQSITGVSRNSVANYMKIYLALSSSIEEILNLSDADLEDLFHPQKILGVLVKLVYQIILLTFKYSSISNRRLETFFEEDKNIKKAYEYGYTKAEIANFLNISHSTVLRILIV